MEVTFSFNRFNNEYYHKKGFDDKGYIFFCQRWLELLDQRTLDTHQYCLFNSFTALLEIQNVVDKTSNGAFSTDDNYEACRNELLRLLKADDIIKKNNIGLHQNLLKMFGDSLGSDRVKKARLLRVKHQIQYALGILKDVYPLWILKEVELDIKSNMQHLLQHHTKILISQCLSRGWTRQGLYELNRLLSKDKTANENWKLFSEALFEDASLHDVYISVQMDPKNKQKKEYVLETIKKLGIGLFTYNEIINQYKDRISEDKIPANKDKMYFHIRKEAMDPYSSALYAVNLLNSKISLLVFYGIMLPWKIDTTDAFVLWGCGQNPGLKIKQEVPHVFL